MQRILKICQQSSSGSDLLEEQLVNSGAPEIAIYLRTYLRARPVNLMIAAAKTAYARSAQISMNKYSCNQIRLDNGDSYIVASKLVDHCQTVGHL